MTITGVKEISGEKWNKEVQYLYNGKEAVAKQPNEDGEWTVEVELEKQRNETLSGSVAVYRVLNEDYYEDQKQYNLRQLLRMGAKKKYLRKLIKYRKEVRGSRIDMSKHLDFQHGQEEWIERTINVGKHIRKRFEDRFNNKMKPPPNRKIENSGVFMMIRDPNQPDFQAKEKEMKKLKPYIAVSARLTFWENGKLKATLKAPEGTYNLNFNEQFFIEDYNWPPEE